MPYLARRDYTAGGERGDFKYVDNVAIVIYHSLIVKSNVTMFLSLFAPRVFTRGYLRQWHTRYHTQDKSHEQRDASRSRI